MGDHLTSLTPAQLAEKVQEAMWANTADGRRAGEAALSELVTRATFNTTHYARLRDRAEAAEAELAEANERLAVLDNEDRLRAQDLAGRVAAAEAERDEAKQRAAQNKGVWQECEQHVSELEARLATLTAALEEIAEGKTPLAHEEIARAALHEGGKPSEWGGNVDAEQAALHEGEKA